MLKNPSTIIGMVVNEIRTNSSYHQKLKNRNKNFEKKKIRLSELPDKSVKKSNFWWVHYPIYVNSYLRSDFVFVFMEI